MTCRLSGLRLQPAALPVLSNVKNRVEKKGGEKKGLKNQTEVFGIYPAFSFILKGGVAKT